MSSISSSFSSCTESCGWWAAIIAALAYGTYGVPIKEIQKYNLPSINPFVFQTYKTTTMFLCCGLLLYCNVLQFTFCPYGLLSGLLWVCGGTCGVIAVRYAGMAIAVGTWASVMIFVNFIWGILIFQEPVANIYSTMVSFLLLGIGLCGMSTYSQPDESSPPKGTPLLEEEQQRMLLNDNISSNQYIDIEGEDNIEEDNNESSNDCDNMQELEDEDTNRTTATPWGSFQNLARICSSTTQQLFYLSSLSCNHNYNGNNEMSASNCSYINVNITNHCCNNDNNTNYGSIIQQHPATSNADTPSTISTTKTTSTTTSNNNTTESSSTITISFWNGRQYVMSKRTIGIIGAVLNGVMTGTSFIPVHYAKAFGFGGAHYMISYAIGAVVSNVLLWIVYILIVYMYITIADTNNSNNSPSSSVFHKRICDTYNRLPNIYFKQLWFPGFMAGLFLTTAMFGTLISVTYLGQGVGNSLIQAKILVSGMWGIFWYKEISDRNNIRKWFLSAFVTVAGILWLSYERLEADKMNQYHHIHHHPPIMHTHHDVLIHR